MFFLFLIVHIIICLIVIAVSVTKKNNRIDITKIILILCVPVVGILMMASEWIGYNCSLVESKSIDLEKLKVDDIKFQKIKIADFEHRDITVPLEEAVILDNEEIRKNLMIDILSDVPENNIDILKMASLTDDTEISHYATTTMMRIQSEYENKINIYESKIILEPDNQSILRKYRAILKKYIDSGLISGKIKEIYCEKLDNVLLKLKEKDSLNQEYSIEWIENRICMNLLDGLYEKIQQMLDKWQNDEKIYILYVKYAYAISDRKLIDEIIEMVQQKNIYLSKDGREWFDFWKREI